MCTAPVFAQAANKQEKSEFNPHWFMQVQAGASYTLGEGPFGKLVSPAAALSAGYQFSPVWGLRFGLSGWQSKGAWVSPQTTYQYKYLQGNVEATLDLANLFGRFNPRRTVNPYLFAGVGLNGAFDNDEANALNDSGYRLGNIWSGSKVFVAGRLGLGVNFRLSDCVLLGVEVNANMLSDKYNSKKAGNLDWQFNALGGFKVQGKTADSARKLLEDAHAVEEAGAFAVVLEAIPAELAARVSAELTIPTIGIGAGAGCDGQVLVNQDMLGMFHDFTPKFVRRFAEVGDVMLDAYRAYDAAVKDGTFPAAEHTYAAPAGVLETL